MSTLYSFNTRGILSNLNFAETNAHRLRQARSEIERVEYLQWLLRDLSAARDELLRVAVTDVEVEPTEPVDSADAKREAVA